MMESIEAIFFSVALVCLLAELMTLNFVTICISIGSMFAWGMVRSELPVWAAAITFVMISAALIMLLRPALKKFMLPDKDIFHKY